MAQLYGKWLIKDYDYDYVGEKLQELSSEHREKYQQRVFDLYDLAQLIMQNILHDCPELDNRVHVSYPNILALSGRYMNDILHYKLWHNINTTNKSKMISHLIKWAQINPVIFVSLNREEYEALSEDIRELCLSINDVFIHSLIDFIIAGFSNKEVPYKKYKKIFYLLDTGQFDCKNASLLFDEIFE